MLSAVLSKEKCAECRFCCSFRRQSLWELPRLPLDFVSKYPTDYKGEPVRYHIITSGQETFALTVMEDKYRTDDPEEEVPCPFLNPQVGCILPLEDKPLDCKAWPLRYMRMPDGSKKVCLTPTCPHINGIDITVMRQNTKQIWKDKIARYAEAHPYIITAYREGFIVLE